LWTLFCLLLFLLAAVVDFGGMGEGGVVVVFSNCVCVWFFFEIQWHGLGLQLLRCSYGWPAETLHWREAALVHPNLQVPTKFIDKFRSSTGNNGRREQRQKPLKSKWRVAG